MFKTMPLSNFDFDDDYSIVVDCENVNDEFTVNVEFSSMLYDREVTFSVRNQEIVSPFEIIDLIVRTGFNFDELICFVKTAKEIEARAVSWLNTAKLMRTSDFNNFLERNEEDFFTWLEGAILHALLPFTSPENPHGYDLAPVTRFSIDYCDPGEDVEGTVYFMLPGCEKETGIKFSFQNYYGLSGDNGIDACLSDNFLVYNILKDKLKSATTEVSHLAYSATRFNADDWLYYVSEYETKGDIEKAATAAITALNIHSAPSKSYEELLRHIHNCF